MSTISTSSKRWGARSIAALLIFVIAAVLAPVALVGHWGHRTVVDSSRYIDTVGPLIDNPEVQQGISAAITDAVISNVNTTTQVESLLDSVFPDSRFNSQLAAPIAAGINTLIGELVSRFVASDAFAAVWIDLNTAAQKGLVAVLEGNQEGPVRVQGDQLVLDISAALARVQQFLVDNGISAAANISLPQNDRQVVLLDTPALSQVQFIYALTSPILQWAPLIVAALFALAIALSRRRARLVVVLGGYLVIIAALLTMGLNSGEVAFNNQLAHTPFGPASEVFWSTLLAYLILGVQAVLVLGAVAIVGGWLGGRTVSGRWARGHLVKGLDELGDRMTGLHPLRTFVARYATALRWISYAIVGLILISSDVMSPATVLWCTALAAGLVTFVQLLSNVPSTTAPELEPTAAPTP